MCAVKLTIFAYLLKLERIFVVLSFPKRDSSLSISDTGINGLFHRTKLFGSNIIHTQIMVQSGHLWLIPNLTKILDHFPSMEIDFRVFDI